MYLFRRKTQGEETLPQTNNDLLNLPTLYKTLDSGEEFLLSANEVDGGVALIFLSDFGRRILAHSEQWCMDGTFKVIKYLFLI